MCSARYQGLWHALGAQKASRWRRVLSQSQVSPAGCWLLSVPQVRQAQCEGCTWHSFPSPSGKRCPMLVPQPRCTVARACCAGRPPTLHVVQHLRSIQIRSGFSCCSDLLQLETILHVACACRPWQGTIIYLSSQACTLQLAACGCFHSQQAGCCCSRPAATSWCDM